MRELNTIEEAIEVLQAMKAGKIIQIEVAGCEWVDMLSGDRLKMPAFLVSRHRVKPEPRRIWINTYHVGMDHIHTSKEKAENSASGGRVECVEYIEVIK